MNGSSKAEITNQEKTGERCLAIPHSRGYRGGGGGGEKKKKKKKKEQLEKKT